MYMNRRAFIFPVAASLLFAAVSCQKDDMKDKYYVSLLTEVFSEYPDSRNNSTMTIEYAQYDENMNIVDLDQDGIYRFMPKIRRQTITGDTISSIVYTFGLRDSLKINTVSDSGEREYSFTTSSGRVSSVYSKTDNAYVPYVDYSFDSYGMVTKKDSTVTYTSESEMYIKGVIEPEGGTPETVISYKYEADTTVYPVAVPNILRLPQTESPVHRHFCYSRYFGSPGKYFYNRAIVKENGADVIYTHEFTLDQDGLLLQDKVMRDGSPYVTIHYTYTKVLVDEKKK